MENSQRVNSEVWFPEGEGVSTLINMGNTCFMNSALQCLMHTNEMVKFMHQNTFYKCKYCQSKVNIARQNKVVCWNCKNPLGIDLEKNPLENPNHEADSLAIEFVKSVRSLTIGYWEDNCRIQPETFHRTFAMCLKKLFHTDVFRLGDQQDSQECLVYILDLLHMGMSKPVRIVNKEVSNAPHVAWKDHLKNNNHSVMTDIFHGLSRTCIQCDVCNTLSKKYDPFSFLSLPFPANVKSITLEDMLKFYSYPETLTNDNKYNCEKCEKQFKLSAANTNDNPNNPVKKFQGCDAKKKIELWMLPNTLIIDFKRYKVNMFKFPNGSVGMRKTKINAFVKCPMELDFQPFLPQQIVNSPRSNRYELYAVIYHSGGLGGGHYVSACKLKDKGWIMFDDANFKQITEDEVVNSLIYVAFYRKKQL